MMGHQEVTQFMSDCEALALPSSVGVDQDEAFAASRVCDQAAFKSIRRQQADVGNV
jgi:hypothetical protein